jgi:hypothetical protein
MMAERWYSNMLAPGMVMSEVGFIRMDSFWRSLFSKTRRLGMRREVGGANICGVLLGREELPPLELSLDVSCDIS